jgi:hypothetical protein
VKLPGGRTLAWGMLAVGGLFAMLAPSPVNEPPPRRGPYFVLAADFHVHSFLGDGALAPWALPGEAQRRGLHALAITNHNQTWAARMARWMSRGRGGPLVLVGQEVTNPRYHIAAVGLARTVDWDVPALEAIDAIHEQGGIAIAAHPDLHFSWGFDDRARAKLDGAERMHPAVFVSPVKAGELEDFFSRASQQRPGLAAVGSSDFHAMSTLGLCRTYVFATEVSERGILEALRAGRTAVLDERGRPRGAPDLVPLIDGIASASSLPSATMGGGVAWLGLVLLVLVRPSSKEEALG